MSLKTLKATEAQIGMKLRNNDPRKAGTRKEYVTINGVQEREGRVTYMSDKRLCYISLDRIFTDGHSRHQGYNTVADPMDSNIAIQTLRAQYNSGGPHGV